MIFLAWQRGKGAFDSFTSLRLREMQVKGAWMVGFHAWSGTVAEFLFVLDFVEENAYINSHCDTIAGHIKALLLTLLQSVLQNWNLLHLVRELQFWRTVRSSTSSCPRWRGLHWAGSRQGAGREPMVQDAQIRNWKDSVRMCETWNRPFAFPLDLE